MNFHGIREARKAAGITQEDLAHSVGINRATLSKYESGVIEPSVSQLLSIASALNTSLTELLGFEYGDGVLFTVDLSPELVQALGFPSYVKKLTTSNPELMLKIVTEFARQSPERVKLNLAFDSLNQLGQQEATKRVEELTEIPRYRAEPTPEAPPPSEGTEPTPTPDTPGMEKPTGGLENGE